MASDSLKDFVEDVCGDSHLRIEADLGDGFVRLKSAEAERRQAAHDIRSSEDIVIEMLRNARDAHANSIFLAVTRAEKQRKLTMIDDGDGIPPAMHDHIFEPRVTSKLDTMHMDKWGVHGRGMALYSIAVNTEVAHVAASDTGKGAAFVVESNLDRLGEKTDQSTFPVFELTEAGSVAVRGPKNILRTACEFALECRSSCSVYLGSATDIAATLYAFGLSSMTSSARAFCSDPTSLAVCKRLSVSPDPAAFSEQAQLMGLELSERSARRIMDGYIAPLPSLLERIHIEGLPQKSERTSHTPALSTSKPTPINHDARGLHITDEDLKSFSRAIREDFEQLADAYYLDASVKPEIKVSKDGIRIHIPVIKQR